jgi:hypothetical protein
MISETTKETTETEKTSQDLCGRLLRILVRNKKKKSVQFRITSELNYASHMTNECIVPKMSLGGVGLSLRPIFRGVRSTPSFGYYIL